MKKLLFILSSFLLSLSTYAAMNVNKIDPPFWYAGMKNPELQLMVYGEGIGDASVSVNYPGVSLSSTVKLESNNYLLVYLHLDKEVKPGKLPLTFTIGKKKLQKGMRTQRFRYIRRSLPADAGPFCKWKSGQ